MTVGKLRLKDILKLEKECTATFLRRIKMDEQLDINMIKVLTQPPVPPAVHYVNPRTIMGQVEKTVPLVSRSSLHDLPTICQSYCWRLA